MSVNNVSAGAPDVTPIVDGTSIDHDDNSQKIEPTSLAREGNAAEIVNTTAVTRPPDTIDDKRSVQSPLQALWNCAEAHAHKEIWGVTLSNPDKHIPSQIVFQKFLNANDGDIAKAKDQLQNTLDFRTKTDPLSLLDKHFSKDKFAGLGYVTSYISESGTSKEVFTWNIYGGVKDIQKSFGDLDAFIEWRVALMELAMKELNLSDTTEPITAEDDRYKMYQVHDYKGVSFLRSPPAVRGVAKKTVEVLAVAYPETLKEKFFVNIPAILGALYHVMKMFAAPKTLKKFHPMSNGSALHLEFADSPVKGLGARLPQQYGGQGEELKDTAKELVMV